MERVLAVVGVVVLAGCGPVAVVQNGVYEAVSDSSVLAWATLGVDLTARTTLVRPAGASTPVVLQMTRLPEAQWKQACPTNFSSVLVETWALAPDPAVVGTVSLERPQLLAGCRMDTPQPDEVVLSSAQALITFRRLTR